eukprot:8135986-Pyramimonas_sp.AAC.1
MWAFPDVPAQDRLVTKPLEASPPCVAGVHIDDHLELLNIYVRWAARYAFGDPKRQPRQKWLSAQVWDLIQHVAPLRRARHSLLLLERASFQRFCLAAWRSMVSPGFRALRRVPARSWFHYGSAVDHDVVVCQYRWQGALAHATIFRLQHAAKPILERDRQAFLDSMAMSASNSMAEHDPRQAYAVIRALSGSQHRATPCVFPKDGAPTSDPPA